MSFTVRTITNETTAAKSEREKNEFLSEVVSFLDYVHTSTLSGFKQSEGVLNDDIYDNNELINHKTKITNLLNKTIVGMTPSELTEYNSTKSKNNSTTISGIHTHDIFRDVLTRQGSDTSQSNNRRLVFSALSQSGKIVFMTPDRNIAVVIKDVYVSTTDLGLEVDGYIVGSDMFNLFNGLGKDAMIIRIKSNMVSFAFPFNGPNSAMWTKSDGWSNGNPFQVGWRSDHVSFTNGLLNITLDNNPLCSVGSSACSNQPYASGEYKTNKPLSYGTSTFSVKPTKGSGVVNGVFMYTGVFGTTSHDEIDIEFLGKDTTTVQLNYFHNGIGGHEVLINLGFDASLAFHTYTIEWLPNSIKWLIDGVVVHTVTTSIPNKPMNLFLNLWATTGVDAWSGPFTYTTPLTFSIDSCSYVGVSQDTYEVETVNDAWFDSDSNSACGEVFSLLNIPTTEHVIYVPTNKLSFDTIYQATKVVGGLDYNLSYNRNAMTKSIL